MPDSIVSLRRHGQDPGRGTPRRLKGLCVLDTLCQLSHTHEGALLRYGLQQLLLFATQLLDLGLLASYIRIALEISNEFTRIALEISNEFIRISLEIQNEFVRVGRNLLNITSLDIMLMSQCLYLRSF